MTLFNTLFIVLIASLVKAQITKLFIPDFDPQALSASIIGVGSDGRTTFLISPGQPTGDQSSAEIPMTVTFVAGAHDAGYTIASDGFTVAETCTLLGNDQAECIISATGNGETELGVMTKTESVIEIPVQFAGGTGGATSVTLAPTNPSSSSGGARPSSAAPTSGSVTGPAPPAQTSKPSAALASFKPSIGALVVMLFMGLVGGLDA